jgi:lysozyme
VTLKFPDVSHYNAPLSMQGAPVVIAKATEGASFKDPYYGNFRAQASSLKVPFMGYHWVNTDSIANQAANAHSVMGNIPCMWDAEAAGVTVDRLVQLTASYRSLGGVVHMVYLPHWFWQNHMGAPDLSPLANLGLHLVSSNYTAYSDTGPGWAPYGGMTPVQWQYSDSVVFNGKPVDFNAFKGTAEEYQTLITGISVKETGMTVAALVHDKTGKHYWSDMVTSVRPVGPGPRDEVNDFYRFMGRVGPQYMAEIRCKNFNPSREPYGEPLDSPTYEELIAMGLVDLSLSGGGLSEAQVQGIADARISASRIVPPTA